MQRFISCFSGPGLVKASLWFLRQKFINLTPRARSETLNLMWFLFSMMVLSYEPVLWVFFKFQLGSYLTDLAD